MTNEYGTVPFDWSSPEWSVADRVHNWRNYITGEVQALWPTFTDNQKRAIARMADGMAAQEDWE